MNLWNKHELAQKHQVGLLIESSTPITLRFRELPDMTILDEVVARWRDDKGQPFPEDDLDLKRVGVCSQDIVGGIILPCFPISWAQYSIMKQSEHRMTLPAREHFHSMAVCGVVRTTDDHYVLSRRSKNVSIYQNMWHVSAAGFIDFDPAKSALTTLFQFFRELQEELAILPTDIIRLQQLGVCQHLVPDSASVEICMSADVRLTAHEVLERAKDAEDSWEGKAHAFPITKVVEMLGMESEEKFNPGGAATLIMAMNL